MYIFLCLIYISLYIISIFFLISYIYIFSLYLNQVAKWKITETISISKAKNIKNSQGPGVPTSF